MKTRILFALLLTVLVQACSMPARLDDDGAGFSSARATGDPQQAMHAELIGTMLGQKQYYAALAHIQQAVKDNGSTPQLRYLEAETRRKLGQLREAEPLYKGLVRTSGYDGLAFQGLGLVAAARGDLRTAVQQLRVAAGRRPTDANVRNDLGYALMLAGRYQEALPEIATAVELDPKDDRGRNNLLVLLMLKGDEGKLKRVAAESGVSGEELARLRAQAQSLKKRRGQ